MFLENENIKLRALEPEDLEFLYKWENASQLWIQGNTLAPYSRNTLRCYINDTQQADIYESRQLKLMIDLKSCEATIGILDIYDFDIRNSRAGIGILIDKNFRNEGYALQALDLVKKYAFSFLHLHQLYAHVSVSNIPSIKLFENAGYKSAGLLKDWIYKHPRYEDVQILQIITTDNNE